MILSAFLRYTVSDFLLDDKEVYVTNSDTELARMQHIFF